MLMDAPKKMPELYAAFTPCLLILSDDNALGAQRYL